MVVDIDALLQPFKAVMPVKGIFSDWSIVAQDGGTFRISGTCLFKGREKPTTGWNTSEIQLLVPPQGPGQPGFVVTKNSLYILRSLV